MLGRSPEPAGEQGNSALVDKDGILSPDWRRPTSPEGPAEAPAGPVSAVHPTSPLYSALMRSKVRTAYLRENADYLPTFTIETANLGFVLLSTDTRTEGELHALCKAAGVTVNTTRLALSVPENKWVPGTTTGSLHTDLRDAAKRLPCSGLDVVCLGVLSASLSLGEESSCAALHRGIHPRQGHATSAGISLSWALRALSARRVAVLTPFHEEVGRGAIVALQQAGIKVVSRHHLGIKLEDQVWRVERDFISHCLQGIDDPAADAILVLSVCDVHWVEELETTLGKPVVTDTLAMFWRALRLAGHTAAIQGFGQLLSQPLGGITAAEKAARSVEK